MLHNRLAVGTLSLSQNDSHLLDAKIEVAARYGYRGIEVVYSDLERYAEHHGIPIKTAASRICTLCAQHKLTILALAPFENFEGNVHITLRQRLDSARHWLQLARALGATHLQVPANYQNDSTSKTIITDLQALSDLAAATANRTEVRIAYEPMSWSTHVSTWETALNVIKAVNKANFGLCLDSFHILTKLWGDNTAKNGLRVNADVALSHSLTRFVTTFPLDKLFYVQLSDAERFVPPWTFENDPRKDWYVPGEAAEFTWSKHARPFPGEAKLGGYLPVDRFVEECVRKMEYKGWISMEIFDRRMRDASHRLEDAARRGAESWDRLKRAGGLVEAKL